MSRCGRIRSEGHLRRSFQGSSEKDVLVSTEAIGVVAPAFALDDC